MHTFSPIFQLSQPVNALMLSAQSVVSAERQGPHLVVAEEEATVTAHVHLEKVAPVLTLSSQALVVNSAST